MGARGEKGNKGQVGPPGPVVLGPAGGANTTIVGPKGQKGELGFPVSHSNYSLR